MHPMHTANRKRHASNRLGVNGISVFLCLDAMSRQEFLCFLFSLLTFDCGVWMRHRQFASHSYFNWVVDITSFRIVNCIGVKSTFEEKCIFNFRVLRRRGLSKSWIVFYFAINVCRPMQISWYVLNNKFSMQQIYRRNFTPRCRVKWRETKNIRRHSKWFTWAYYTHPSCSWFSPFNLFSIGHDNLRAMKQKFRKKKYNYNSPIGNVVSRQMAYGMLNWNYAAQRWRLKIK